MKEHQPTHAVASLLALSLALSLSLHGRAGAAELEGHDSAPALEEVAARAHFADDPAAHSAWQRKANAAIEFAAMASVLYRDDVALFNARDGAIPYYVARYLGADQPHWRLIAMSPNTGSMDHPESSAYLRENGVSDETLAGGRRLVLLDGSVGWGRTLGRMRLELSPPRRHELLVHSMMGFGEDHGPTQRLSLLQLWNGPARGAQMPTMGEAAPHWEDGITFDINAAAAYARGPDGKLVAQAAPASTQQRDAGRQWKEHLRHLLDQPESRALFKARQALWKEAAHALAGDSGALLHWLDRTLEQHPGSLGEAIARDVTAIALKHHRDRHTWDYLPGFSELAETLAGQRGQASIKEPLRRLASELAARGGATPPPPDGSLLLHPHTGAIYITQRGKKWWIPDPQSFEVMGLSLAAVRAAEPQHLDRLPDAEQLDLHALGRLPRDGSLLRDPANGAVYQMRDGRKWHVPDPQTFARMRLRMNQLRPAHGRLLSQIPSR